MQRITLSSHIEVQQLPLLRQLRNQPELLLDGRGQALARGVLPVGEDDVQTAIESFAVFREPITASHQPKQLAGMPRDHQFLVGGNHPGRNFAVLTGDSRPTAGVGIGIQLQAQPGGGLTDSAADFR